MDEFLIELANRIGADLNNADDRRVCEELLKEEETLVGRRQFPFDEICEQITRELERRNWQVLGITVSFGEFESKERSRRNVREVSGRDFCIHFGLGTTINIPRKELAVYPDESGPVLRLYVGDNWERDGEEFAQGCNYNSRRDGRPRTYLRYRGGCFCFKVGWHAWLAGLPHTHLGERAPLLVHYNDMEREYDPESDEPDLFNTDEVMEEFRRYLEENVLKIIMSA